VNGRRTPCPLSEARTRSSRIRGGASDPGKVGGRVLPKGGQSDQRGNAEGGSGVERGGGGRLRNMWTLVKLDGCGTQSTNLVLGYPAHKVRKVFRCKVMGTFSATAGNTKDLALVLERGLSDL